MKIDLDKVPSTVEAAVDALIASFNEEDRLVITGLSDPASVHFGTGMYIRNEWSLWEPDSPIKRDAVAKYKIAHADDISGLIFAWTFAKVRGEPFDPVAYCQRFHDHWAKHNMTSLQAGCWKE